MDVPFEPPEETDLLTYDSLLKSGSLACCDSWGFKELDTTERLN